MRRDNIPRDNSYEEQPVNFLGDVVIPSLREYLWPSCKSQYHWSKLSNKRADLIKAIRRSSESEKQDFYNKAFNLIHNVAISAASGFIFYQYQKLREEFNEPQNIQNSETTINYDIQFKIYATAAVMLSLSLVNFAINKIAYPEINLANYIKKRLYKMPNNQKAMILESDINDENALAELQKAKLPTKSQKLAVTYAFAVMMINGTNLPENRQYILYFLSRITAKSFIELVEEYALNKFDFNGKVCCYNFSTNLFSKNLLNRFSSNEKKDLLSALKEETTRSDALDRNYEFLYSQIIDWVRICSFFVILHNKPFSNIAAEPNETIYNFALASFVALTSYYVLESSIDKLNTSQTNITNVEANENLPTYSSEHKQSECDVDLEAGNNADSHKPKPEDSTFFTKNETNLQIKRSRSCDSFLDQVKEEENIKKPYLNLT